jgi:hypothetical protein
MSHIHLAPWAHSAKATHTPRSSTFYLIHRLQQS